MTGRERLYVVISIPGGRRAVGPFQDPTFAQNAMRDLRDREMDVLGIVQAGDRREAVSRSYDLSKERES